MGSAPKDAIEHVAGCDGPVPESGVGYTCDCAMYQGQFPPPDGYEGPVPTDAELRLAATREQHWPADVAFMLARHREELLAPIREALAAHDGNAPPSAYETLRRIREAIGG